MKLRKIYLFILLFALINIFWNIAYSYYLNLRDCLVLYFEWVSQWIENMWNDWENIDIKYKNISSDKELYQALQKWVYLWLFPNESTSLPLKSDASQELFAKIIEKESDIILRYSKWNIASPEWVLDIIKETLSNIAELRDLEDNIKEDVLFNMKNYFLYKDEIDWDNLKCENITWCAEIWKDDYTKYIEPNMANDFKEELEWNFEWIWTYIHMAYTWIFVIESVIPWWPAEKWWLKSWDIFLQINNNKINQKTTIYDLSNRIKWPSGSSVRIKIRRWNDDLIFNIERGVITLPNISYKKVKWDACYMKIEQFNHQTLQQFKSWLNYFQDKNCSTYIFDLRNNPGGDLEIVTNMLNYFVDDWNTIVEMRYANSLEYILANNQKPKISWKNIILLVNWSTASASEIFAWVLCDYIENCQMVWQTTYWKWTAQSLIEYVDWSILKFTIAKRYTGKSKTNIDGKWFNPNIFMTDEKIDLFLKELGLK